MSDLQERAIEARKAVQQVADLLADSDLTHEERTDLWATLKRTANIAYALCKRMDPDLLGVAGKSRGWVASDGTPIEVKRRFETELLDEDEFSAWCGDRDVSPFETKVAVSSAARELVKRTVLEDGEAVPGVSAGLGAPFLSLGRRS